MKLNVRISYFNQAKVYDPADYPEKEYVMSEEMFSDILRICYYDEDLDMWYTNDNAYGFTILGVIE